MDRPACGLRLDADPRRRRQRTNQDGRSRRAVPNGTRRRIPATAHIVDDCDAAAMLPGASTARTTASVVLLHPRANGFTGMASRRSAVVLVGVARGVLPSLPSHSRFWSEGCFSSSTRASAIWRCHRSSCCSNGARALRGGRIPPPAAAGAPVAPPRGAARAHAHSWARTVRPFGGLQPRTAILRQVPSRVRPLAWESAPQKDSSLTSEGKDGSDEMGRGGHAS